MIRLKKLKPVKPVKKSEPGPDTAALAYPAMDTPPLPDRAAATVPLADRAGAMAPLADRAADTAPLADRAADTEAVVDLAADTEALVDLTAEPSLLDPMADTAVLDPETLSALNGELDIALVDDDPVIGVMIKRVLGSKGYSVMWFSDGLAAVAALCKPTASVRAKLILLDVSMPGLGGWGVLHYLHRDGVLDKSRVIMLTASTSEQDVRQAIGLGATGYLAKPLNIRLLILRVKHALGK